MEIKIQSLKFDAGEKLTSFVEKKVARLSKFFAGQEPSAEVTLIQEKAGKTAKIRACGFVIERTSDTFENAVSACVETMKVKLAREKEKKAQE